MANFSNIFTDYTFQIVALGSAVLGILCGVIGSFAVLKKQSLLGDSISHSSLSGIALAFLITGNKDTGVLLIGAFLSGIFATFCILFIKKYSTLKFDAALALVMSVFFGFGLVLLTYIQKIPNSDQAGLKTFIFGQASTLLKRDIIFMSLIGIILIFLVILFWKEFKLFTFDKELAKCLGFHPDILNFVFSMMLVTTIVIGLQTVGVILMSALLISPAVAARQWTNKLHSMVILAAIFGALSGVLGTTASSLVSGLPTGPAIVVFISIIAMASLTFAPKRGILWKLIARKKYIHSLHPSEFLNQNTGHTGEHSQKRTPSPLESGEADATSI